MKNQDRQVYLQGTEFSFWYWAYAHQPQTEAASLRVAALADTSVACAVHTSLFLFVSSPQHGCLGRHVCGLPAVFFYFLLI